MICQFVLKLEPVKSLQDWKTDRNTNIPFLDTSEIYIGLPPKQEKKIGTQL